MAQNQIDELARENACLRKSLRRNDAEAKQLQARIADLERQKDILQSHRRWAWGLAEITADMAGDLKCLLDTAKKFTAAVEEFEARREAVETVGEVATIPPAPSEPGPALDAWLAEHLMGWRRLSLSTPGGYWRSDKKRTCMIFDSELHKSRIALGITGDRIGDGFVWAPSRDPGAAFADIAPAMRTRGYVWTADDDGPDGACQWQFDPYFPGDMPVPGGKACHKDVAGAFCLAAKAALEAEGAK